MVLQQLFQQLYEQLKTEPENDSSTKSGCFLFFVENILEKEYGKFNYINERTITNYYNKYVEQKENNAGEPKIEFKNYVANYLGYKSFLTFEASLNTNQTIKTPIPQKKPEESFWKKVGKLALIVVPVVIILSIYFSKEKANCIIWKTNHFEKADCNQKNSLDNTLYSIDITNFKKIEVDTNTIFFKKGTPIIWYGKNKAGKMEFFTARGIHPETLHELNDISETIINKYVYLNKKDKTILD